MRSIVKVLPQSRGVSKNRLLLWHNWTIARCIPIPSKVLVKRAILVPARAYPEGWERKRRKRAGRGQVGVRRAHEGKSGQRSRRARRTQGESGALWRSLGGERGSGRGLRAGAKADPSTRDADDADPVTVAFSARLRPAKPRAPAAHGAHGHLRLQHPDAA